MRKKKSKKRAVSETPAIRRLGSEVLDVGDTSGIASQSLGVGGQGANWKCFPSPPGQLWQQRPLHLKFGGSLLLKNGLQSTCENILDLSAFLSEF